MEQTFGAFIRQKRLDRMIKLNAFAKMVGISNVYQSYIETGKRPAPTALILERMACVLNLDSDDLQKMYYLASLSHAKQVLPHDLGTYIMEHPYILETLIKAKSNNTSEADWMEFNNRIY